MGVDPFSLPAWGASSGVATSQLSSGPAYDRVNSIPSWLPKPDTSELSTELSNTGKDYDTNPFDVASQKQQSNVLTTALNAGNNAATEYANKARQAGGSSAGAGLLKAEAGVNAQGAAGDMELKRQQFDADMRDKAATHATQIATTLAGLRSDYLKSLVSYATSEDSIGVQRGQLALDSQKLDETKREFNWKLPVGGSYNVGPQGQIGSVYGTPFRDQGTGMPTNNPTQAAAQTAPINGYIWGG